MLPWLSGKSQDPDGESRTGIRSSLPSTAQAVDSNSHTSAKHASKTAVTAVSTPHDELLAQIHGKRSQLDAVKPNSPDIPDLTSPHLHRHDSTHPNLNLNDPFAEPQGPGSAARTYSTVRTTPDLMHHDVDILSDPFDGKELGVLKADPYDITQLEPGELSSKNEDMWMHLSRISELQNDIAIMHARMEGIGSNTGDKKGKKPLRRDWDDKGVGARSQANMANEGGEDEGVGVQGDEEAEKVKAREEEFSRLADKFTGRKDAIDQIMFRLDDLSQALTTFHALRTPTLDFGNTSSRSNSFTETPTSPKPAHATSTSNPPTPSSSTAVPPPMSRSAPGTEHALPILNTTGISRHRGIMTESPVSLGSIQPFEA